MIDNKNIDKGATFIRQVVTLTKDTIGASQTDVEQKSFRAPYSGTILSVHVHAVAITDADDGARVDVKKATTSVLTGTINPTAGSNVAGTLKTDGTQNFVAGDKLGVFVTTGVGDNITDLSVTLVVRANCADEAVRPSV